MTEGRFRLVGSKLLMSSVLEQEKEMVTEVSIESVLLDADLFVKYKSPK